MLRKDENSADFMPAAVQRATKWSWVDIFPSPFIVALASPYLAGKNAEEALRMSQQLFKENHFCGTVDILGEDALTKEESELYVQKFCKLIDAVVAAPIPSAFDRERLTISMKPSMFSAGAPANHGQNKSKLDEAFDRMIRVVDYAAQRKVRLTLEAEDSRWTNFQLDAYNALINAGYLNLGTVLQTRLFRTKKDLERFDQRGRVRLVVGIYQEPANIAHTDRNVMKDLLVRYAQDLIARGSYVEFATHDLRYIDKFFTEVVLPSRISATQFETQFLLGVPRLLLQKSLVNGEYFRKFEVSNTAVSGHAEALRRSGVLVRMYLPYGPDRLAGPYCKRRLTHNPNLIVYGIKNLLHIQ
jgi:proline dehydrogenase